jgi:lysine biosynthesis protein LysW
MATCPECEAELDLDEFDVDTGDSVSCDGCGAILVVVRLSPLELEVADEEAEDEGYAEDEGLLEAEGSDDDDLE